MAPRSTPLLAITVRIACPDLDAAWRALDRVGRLDPWCLDLDEPSLTVRALFPAPPAALELTHALEPAAAARFGSGWSAVARATQVGPLWVLPPERKAPSGARFVVRVDALKAFGAGTYETTTMCLERVVERAPVEALLDVGTGSGVLALAALRLGATHAVGVDLEDALLEEARRNARHNGLADRFQLTLELPARAFPLVLANVRTPALIALVDRLIAATQPDGELVLSGIREEERDEVLPLYVARGMVLRAAVQRGDWLRLDLLRPE